MEKNNFEEAKMKYITQQVVPHSTRRTRKRTKSQPYLQGKGTNILNIKNIERSSIIICPT